MQAIINEIMMYKLFHNHLFHKNSHVLFSFGLLDIVPAVNLLSDNLNLLLFYFVRCFHNFVSFELFVAPPFPQTSFLKSKNRFFEKSPSSEGGIFVSPSPLQFRVLPPSVLAYFRLAPTANPLASIYKNLA